MFIASGDCDGGLGLVMMGLVMMMMMMMMMIGFWAKLLLLLAREVWVGQLKKQKKTGYFKCHESV